VFVAVLTNILRCAVLDSKSRVPTAQTESSPFGLMKQEPISGLGSTGHLPGGYQACDGLLGGGAGFSVPGPVGVHHPQTMTRVNNLRVNYANRGSTIRSYHCRLCRKVCTVDLTLLSIIVGDAL